MNDFKDCGYSVTPILSTVELQGLRDRINKQIKKVVQDVDPQSHLLSKSSTDLLSQYHKFEFNNHSTHWIKTNRLLNCSDTTWFEQSESIQKLFDIFGCIRVSDEEKIGRSNYYWRLTRPYASDDIGPIHRDEWFWILNNNFDENLDGLKRIKVWIAIQTVQGKNGLIVQPKSHKREDIKWELEKLQQL